MKLWPSFTHPIHLAGGLTIWAAWFTAVYGGLSLACFVPEDPATVPPGSWINIMLIVFTLATTALLVWLAVRCWRASPARASGEGQKQNLFTLRVSAALYLCAAVATLAVGLPIIVLSPCI